MKTIKEAAKRALAKPVVKKQPVSPHNMKQLMKKLWQSADLLQMRTLTLALLSYAGFLRYDEVHRVRREHISFLPTYMKIFIPSSKTDQHNVGDYVSLQHAQTVPCNGQYFKFRQSFHIQGGYPVEGWVLFETNRSTDFLQHSTRRSFIGDWLDRVRQETFRHTFV